MPLGYRLEHAAVRAARLQLAQSYYLLKDQEDRVQRTLALYYQAVITQYTKIEANRAERVAYGLAVEARYREFAVGKATVSDFLLDAMRRLVAAQLKEYNAIEEYNSDLSRYEWAKGNSMKHNNVVIADGNIPICAEVSAVKHERERSQAIVLRERPKNDAIRTPGLLAGASNDMPDHLVTPPGTPNASLPPAPSLVDPTPQAENRPDAPAAPIPQVVPPAGTPSCRCFRRLQTVADGDSDGPDESDGPDDDRASRSGQRRHRAELADLDAERDAGLPVDVVDFADADLVLGVFEPVPGHADPDGVVLVGLRSEPDDRRPGCRLCPGQRRLGAAVGLFAEPGRAVDTDPEPHCRLVGLRAKRGFDATLIE